MEENKSIDQMLVIGDSHSIIWEGNHALERNYPSRFKNIHVQHLGPALAYNLLGENKNIIGKWGNQTIEIIQKYLTQQNAKQFSLIMLCFGEIDIRTQVIKRAIFSKGSIEDEVYELAERLNIFSKFLFKKVGIPIILWEPIASRSEKEAAYNEKYPVVGTEIERNFATLKISEFLQKLTTQSRTEGFEIYSFGIANELTNYLHTKREYYHDGYHLNFRGLELAVSRFSKFCKNSNLPFFPLGSADFSPVKNTFTEKDISYRCTIDGSSKYSKIFGLSKTSFGYCFHTERELNPTIYIDCGYAALISRIEIYNRFDSHFERSFPIEISIGMSKLEQKQIFVIDKIWGQNGEPFVMNTENLGPFRYIKMVLKKEDFFHLGSIKIFENSFLN